MKNKKKRFASALVSWIDSPARLTTLAASGASAVSRKTTMFVCTVAKSSCTRGLFASFAAKARSDIAVGQRVFHDKFGYGEVVDQEGNKLEIEFEQAGRKRVIDSFVPPA